MRLWAVVFEGDWSVTDYAAYGNVVAWSMASMPKSPELDEANYLQRWYELDRTILAKAVPVEVTPEALFGDLAVKAYDAAKAIGLARVEDFDDNGRFGGVWLASIVTNERFNDGSTVAEAGLMDGDLIVLCVARHTGIGYMLGPASNPGKLFENLQLVANVQQMVTTPKLWGALLYTDEDTEIATYVRTHFDELNALTGPLLGIFVVERPQSWSSARRYWRQHLDPSLVRMFSAMRWLSWKPYDRHLCYEVARELGVPPAQLPCLVIFHSEPAGTLVFPIDSASPTYLRGLFGEIERAIGQDLQPYDIKEALNNSREYPGGEYALRGKAVDRPQDMISSIKSASVAAFDRVAIAQRRIQDQLRQTSPGAPTYEFHGHSVFKFEGKASMVENFNFLGQTTFINRPVDTVIQDFQRTYVSSSERDRLAELLRLVLTSTSLQETEKEQAAEDIHLLTREVAATEPDKDKVKSKLIALQRAISKAADIAKPALAIVAELVRIFTG